MLKNNTCCFTGHRPNKIYGYDLSNPNYQIIAKKVRSIAEDLFINKGVNTFISGSALGFDTVSFFAIKSLKKKYPNQIQNILAIPFKNQNGAWKNPVDLDRYSRMKSSADKIIYVDEIDEYKANSIGAKLNRRNHYMIDNSNYVIAYWDGTKGGAYNCLQYAKSKNVTNIINIK